LLSQVDASVGGKTGINFAHRKNMVGTFTHPQAVIIDVNTLSTLPKKEISSGLAEAIKHGLIKDEEYLTFLEDIDPENITDDDFVSIVKRSCEIKASVVQEDEKESGLRKILNFGHTIGHAIEALSLDTDNHLLHGEAISIGMVAEAHLSMQEGFISNSELARIEKALQRFSLPARTKKIFHQEVLSMIKSDKKNEEGSIKWTLLKNLGEASFDNHCHEYQIIKSLNYILI
jgi:3-dehydroquinate synthase